MYISQDPIGLAGNNPTLYGYVYDVNTEIDVFGLDAFSDWLSKGTTNNSVYVNAPNGTNNPINYGGITNNPTRRIGEHAGRFDDITVLKGSGQLSRNQARAVEEAIIKNQGLKKAGGGLDNAIHSISPKRAIYNDAVAWGEKWLKDNGHGHLVKDGNSIKKGCH
jgi:predicted GIY-YIG superfamily endonuclease